MGFKVRVPPFLLLILVPFLLCAADVDSGSFLFHVYGSKTYTASPQNWAIAQDSRGLMYFGNTDCLLEFDGTSWRKIVLPNNSTVRSLAVDQQGRVFVGGQGEIGYLGANPKGGTEYVSLLPLLTKEDREFGDVWSLAATRQGVYFNSYQRIIRIQDSRNVTVWRPKKTFGRAFEVRGKFIVEEIGSGLMTLQEDKLVPLPGGEDFAKRDVNAILPVDDGLLVASNKQLFRLSNGRLELFRTSIDSYLQDNTPRFLQYMPDGSIALGTARGGLVLMDKSGAIHRVISEHDGLPDDHVEALFTDRHGETWLASGKGIVRFDSKLTYLGEGTGIRGSVIALARSADGMYAGTTVGLYRMKTRPEHTPEARAVDGIKGTVLVLMPDGNRLLAGTVRGLFSVQGDHATLVTPADVVYDLAPSKRNPDLLYACGRFGVLVMRREGNTWKTASSVPAGAHSLRTVIEDSAGLVWATSRVGVWRIDFAANPPRIDRFGERDGVSAGWNSVFRLGKSLVFATARGILHYSEATKHFEPYLALGKQFADGKRAVSLVREGPKGDVWISGPGYQAIVSAGPERKLFQMPLLQSGVKEIYSLWMDPNGSAWSSGEEGLLFRWGPEATQPAQDALYVILRRVQSQSGKELIYGGGGTGSSWKDPRLPHAASAVRFEFSAASYEDVSATQYQVRLEHLDKEWEPWTEETRKEYTNLFEGHYHFHVRARDGHQNVTPEVDFSFIVLPPWYRTWWAYGIYSALAALAIQLFVLMRLNHLREQKKRLELLVEQRTAEVREQRDKIIEEEQRTERLLLNILPARIATELRSTGSVVPVMFPEVTVCFTDFVGFTLSSELMSAEKLVGNLNLYFTAFDHIMTRYNIEKLKTIGDSYMYVSGLPEQRASHAVDAALAAMEMAQTVNVLASAPDGPGWVARIGLHTGPVAAGVVGISKFAYDVWGDTVNLAARLETGGLPGLVNISTEVYYRIRDFIDCHSRGLVRTKEGRDLEMYFADRIKPELLEGPVVDGIPEAFRKRYYEAFGSFPPAIPAISQTVK